MIAKAAFPVLFSCLWLAHICGGTDISEYYTDLEDHPNPSWYDLVNRGVYQNTHSANLTKLIVGNNSLGPALGSTIRVNQDDVNVGLYANRPIAEFIAIHTPVNSVIPRVWGFGNMTRWYQEDGNTQIFRLFPGDDNVRNTRKDAPRCEAFSIAGWQRGDGWHEWSGRYTFLKVRQGAVFQIKHNHTYWSMQLIVDQSADGTFDLYYVKLRDIEAKTLLVEDVVGKGVDIKVLDDGENHKVFVEGQLMIENSMTDRPLTDINHARWGMYTPGSAMDRDILVFVTGAYVGPMLADGEVVQRPTAEESASFWSKILGWWNSLTDPSTGTSTGDISVDRDVNVAWLSMSDEFDAEPSSEFLESFYQDPESKGRGFF